MKRSEINRIMRKAIKFLKEQNFCLPKFAFWKLDDWKNKGKEIEKIFNINIFLNKIYFFRKTHLI